ncbi:MAG: YdcF family protein [Pyrinomonadaceae bacterium]
MSEAHSKRSSTIWRRLSVAFLLLAFSWLIAWIGARLLIVSAPLQHADAIVVLSGSRAFTERASLAADLYKAGQSSRIILTNDDQRGGWSNADQRNPYFYESAARELRRFGVPDGAIVVVPQPVSSTRDEALLMRDYCERNQLQSILVVSSPYHSRRALRTFRRVFGGSDKTIGLMAPGPGWQSPSPALWWRYRRGWAMVAGEYLKLGYYGFSVQ